MKKIFLILTTIMLIFSFSVTVFATGDSNIDSGGGDMGQGTSSNSWTPGRDGVRVTIIRESDRSAVSASIDFSDESNTDIKFHFEASNKIVYLNGKGLSPRNGNYSSIKPATQMPRIINSNGSNNIIAIREYFGRDGTIQDICNITGFSYDRLISGGYKILLEPIGYFKYQDTMYAMTATEAAKFNQSANNGLRRTIPSLSHQNLPLAMFLEEPELGLPVWTGATSGRQSDQDIISYLGMGIVRFKELPPTPPQNSDITYRSDTDVITSVTLSTGAEKSPSNPAYASFSINGRTYAHSNIYIPKDGSQLAWVKWRTPLGPGIITISISSNCNLSTNTIVAEIVDLDENPPPDPQANDRNDGFSMSNIQSKGNVTSLSWGEWNAWWYEYWVDRGKWKIHTWTDSYGEIHGSRYWASDWKDEGWYIYDWIAYQASLAVDMNISPDEKAPTATSSKMKSGYGFNMNVTSNVRSNAPTSHYTGMQNVVTYFPEFQYQSYWRLLEKKNSGYSINHEFKKNKYSTYNRRTHFSPVWFPDGRYLVYAENMDAWTPAGMMSISLTDDIRITESLFSDWHIGPIH